MVRVKVPCTGCASRIMPAATASAAETSDHQKPGIPRAQNVSARPATPLIRNIQPRKIVTARLASGGRILAARPNTASTIPSNKNAFQCSRTAALISDCNLVMSWGRVIEVSRCRQRNVTRYYTARQRRTVKFVHARGLSEALLALAGRGRKALLRRAHPVATENI